MSDVDAFPPPPLPSSCSSGQSRGLGPVVRAANERTKGLAVGRDGSG